MLVIKKITFTILILCLSFLNLNAKELNSLFDELQKAESIYAAEYIEKNIWRNWVTHPKSKYLTDKLENGTFSMNNNQYRLALKLFSDVISEDPSWAEAWNKRATLLFLMGNYDASLKDIEQVLSLEPRHFGALSGRAQIYLSLKEYEKAITDLEKAKTIYPLIKSGESIELIKKLIKELQVQFFLDLFLAISCVKESTIVSDALKISLGLYS